ncbi:MAG: serine hydrolase [Clostridiales bacterium]|nr:serine hydrolase [Clostridiales bacterium]
MSDQNQILASAISRFIKRLEREDVCIHGFEIRQDGKVRAEGYYAPFEKGQPHRQYSISKSMVSLAIGLLIDDGKCKLTDPICDYFPEFMTENADPRLLRLSIHNMLRMSTCHQKTTYKEGVYDCWAASFFTYPPTHESGTVFSYDTSCSQVLGALAEKLSGMGLLDFLKQRIFDPIGAGDPMRWLTDPSGTPQGGSGLLMSLRDMSKVAQLVMDGGRGLISSEYLSLATSKQINTIMCKNPEERYGYGYQFWRTRSGYAMFGMGGQLAICCPKEQIILSTIANTRLDPYGVQHIYDAFYEEIMTSSAVNEELPAQEAKLQALLSNLEVVKVLHDTAFEKAAWASYAMHANQMGLGKMVLGESCISFEHEQGLTCFPFELGEHKKAEIDGKPVLISAGYYAHESLRIRCFFIGDSPSGIDLLVVTKGDRICVQGHSCYEGNAGFEGFASGERINV